MKKLKPFHKVIRLRINKFIQYPDMCYFFDRVIIFIQNEDFENVFDLNSLKNITFSPITGVFC